MQPVLRKVKKVLCILLSVLMLVSVLPINAFAYEGVTFTALDGTAGASTAGGTENFDKLIDGSVDTKWCVTNFSNAYIVIEASSAIKVSGYQMSTGDDTARETSRNPKDWTLYGCNDYNAETKTGTWDVIHKVIGDTVLQNVNKTTFSFACDMTDVEYKYFKLEITKNSGSEKCMQLSEFVLTDCEHETTVVSTADADCTNYGYIEKSCSVCSLTYKMITEEAKGHTWVEESKIPATCTVAGKINQKCSVCNATQTVNDPDVPALGHTWVEVDRTTATCVVSGKINQKCSVCDATQTVNDPDVPALRHTFVDGYCTRCLNADTTPVKPNGDGTAESPYEISNVGELYWFAGLVNGTLTDGTAKNRNANAKLTADITVNRNVLKTDGSIADDTRDFNVWKPIGYNGNSSNGESKAYLGSFDGQGHTVSGLYYDDTTSSKYYVGLFGYCFTGTIANVNVEDSYFSAYKSVGGICGLLLNGYIYNCKSSATVYADITWVGGICGDQWYNSGSSAGSECVIANCYNEGKVSSPGMIIGGVVGMFNGSQLYNCYTNSDVCQFDAYGYKKSGTIGPNVLKKTGSEIASGEVAYLLSQGCTVGEKTYNGSIWGQKIGTEIRPVFNSDRVYKNCVYGGCIDAPGEPTQINYENVERPAVYAEHSYSEDYLSNNDATCTEDGTKSIKCIYCGLATDTITDEGSVLGHDWADATCLAPKTCNRCDLTEGETLEHDYQFTKTVAPTCYAKGYDIYTCTMCKGTENRNETEMADHETVTTYNEDKTIEHHLCKNHSFVIEETENLPESEHDYQSNTDEYFELSYPGADTITITFDNQFKTETNYDYLKVYDKDGNEIAKYEGTAPAGKTYTLNGDYIKLHFHSDGSMQYYGFKITKVVAEKVGCDYAEPDTPHIHNYGEYVSDGNATCTENGTETATCPCGEFLNRTEENSALGHDYDADVTDPTCKKQGYTTYTCTRCGDTYKGNYTDPAHDYEFRMGESSTCTTGGHNIYVCKFCGDTKREELDPLGHDLVETADAVNATCFSIGWTAGYRCTRCDYEVRQEEVAKLPHKYKTYTTRATTSKNGSVVTKCTVCGTVKSKATIYYPKKITLSTTSYTYDGKVKKPSVKVVGSNGKTISSSNYTVSYASGRKNVGKYVVKVTFKGKYSGTKTLYFTIKPKATSISSISARSKGFTVKWYKRTTQTTGYQVQYSTSSKFTSPKTVTVSKYSTTSKTVSKLKAKKKYYVRVRTYKTVNGTRHYSSWSKAKYVTTKS